MELSRTETAAALMSRFADRTGLSSSRPQRRYLWTDAFAVCTYLGLARATGQDAHRELARSLVDRVHHTLGKERGGAGWLDEASEEHPTRGGLRIGKELPERAPDEPYDDRLEWDRDGQYFHYLTKWMHALDVVGRATGEDRLRQWARELAQVAYRGFVYQPAPSAAPRMYWKMSTDLSRPLVPSMGHHDPLDGLVTYLQLQEGEEEALGEQIAGFAHMLQGTQLATVDPLGLGGLLVDAYRVDQLIRTGALDEPSLLEALLDSALVGLEHYAPRAGLEQPAPARLAFRELGLAIGLRGVERMIEDLGAQQSPRLQQTLAELGRHLPLRERVMRCWLDPDNRAGGSWTEHRDINDVMLAASLAADGCLILPG